MTVSFDPSRQALAKALNKHIEIGLCQLEEASIYAVTLPGLTNDEVSDWANSQLHKTGGLDVVFKRMRSAGHWSSLEWSRWEFAEHADIRLDAFLMADPKQATPRERRKLLALSAIHTAALGDSEGLYTAVGYRVGGNVFDVMPIGEESEVDATALTVNAIVNWRSKLS